MSALGSAGKLSGSFAVCRRKEPSAALQCSTRSLADPKRFSPLFLPLSIQSLRHGMRVCVCMCVYLLRQSRFRAPCTSPTESRLLRHKTQPPLSLLSLSPSTLLLLLPSPTWVANLFGYSYTQKKGGNREEGEAVKRRDWRADFGAPQLRLVEVVFETKERAMHHQKRSSAQHGTLCMEMSH